MRAGLPSLPRELSGSVASVSKNWHTIYILVSNKSRKKKRRQLISRVLYLCQLCFIEAWSGGYFVMSLIAPERIYLKLKKINFGSITLSFLKTKCVPICFVRIVFGILPFTLPYPN